MKEWLGIMLEFTDPFIGKIKRPGWQCPECGWKIAMLDKPDVCWKCGFKEK